MNKNISERLSEIMEEKNISPAELSRRTGIDKSSISRYCSGEYNPGKSNFFKLASALEVNPAWLAGEPAPKRIINQSLIISDPWEDRWMQNPLSSPFDDLTDEESHLVDAYRKAEPAIKAAVRKILDIEEKS